MKPALALLLLASLVTGACSSLADPLAPLPALAAGESLLTTDALEYEIRSEGQMRAVDFDLTYRNPLDVAVAVPACHRPYRPVLQKLVEGQWVDAFSPIELMCITAPLVIPARGTHQFRFELRADAFDLARWPGAAGGSLDGTYRLRWWVGIYDRRMDNGVGQLLPEEYVVSNNFVVRSQ
jgi:hypothetical protein